ncbi:MAG: N-acetyltransferase [Sphaerochaeta sp.]|jgi:acetyltransferase-like isoleucine patch superfamily enzyme|nr:N-acetyltransferase [Sphaerochaeta sp.]
MIDYSQFEQWVRDNVKVWQPCNIYPSASIGRNVSIGTFTEIGNNVVIGNNVRIGAMCFIPEGVVIEDDAWIGPRCTFTNDRFPPSPMEEWEPTIVKRGACLGAAVTVVCGVTIGEGALVGAGSVITKDVPAGQVWAGVPAIPIKEGKDEYSKTS